MSEKVKLKSLKFWWAEFRRLRVYHFRNIREKEAFLQTIGQAVRNAKEVAQQETRENMIASTKQAQEAINSFQFKNVNSDAEDKEEHELHWIDYQEIVRKIAKARGERK